MIRWVIKWVFRLIVLAVVLVAVFLLSLNTLLRILVEHNIRAQTGMDAEIGRFQLGLTEPTITVQDLNIFNPPSFGGTLFMRIPEIHVEYDRQALARRQLHFTLVRFNLGEVCIVKNQRGQTNLFSMGLNPKSASLGNGDKVMDTLKQQTGLSFTGVDSLNVSVGTFKFIDLQNRAKDRTQVVGLDNQVLMNVRRPEDLMGLEVLVALRSGDFFTQIFEPGTGQGGGFFPHW